MEATPAADGRPLKLAVIGGTSLLKSTLFVDLTPVPTPTPHGTVTLLTSTASPLVFLQRHVSTPDGAYTPPHAINHRAHAAALLAAGVTHVLAVCCVGSLNEEVPPGTLVIPDDYSALYCPPMYLHDDARAHIVPGLDAPLRDRILTAVRGWAGGRGGATAACGWWRRASMCRRRGPALRRPPRCGCSPPMSAPRRALSALSV
eukprot:TRINITY_DN1047_c0_g1_i2.p1 TRINITY_DN1047_c0_g1~~TRINITY_DN1047_c0_g1_i2.p1  ORF type:complete len:203 (-),score=63.29 TRINITY_DN1047_c0_g1_i2:273-881(-)